MQRIAERSAELDAVEARYPGRATLTEALADAGISWAEGGDEHHGGSPDLRRTDYVNEALDVDVEWPLATPCSRAAL